MAAAMAYTVAVATAMAVERLVPMTKKGRLLVASDNATLLSHVK